MKGHISLSSFSVVKKGVFWTASGVIITAILCWVAYSQLAESNQAAKDQNRIAAETFLHNLKTDFFTPEARNLILLMDIDALKFQVIREDSGTSSERDLLIFEMQVPAKFKKYTDSILPKRAFYYSNELD